MGGHRFLDSASGFSMPGHRVSISLADIYILSSAADATGMIRAYDDAATSPPAISSGSDISHACHYLLASMPKASYGHFEQFHWLTHDKHTIHASARADDTMRSYQ